jgi:glutamate dehydrogenase
MEGVHLRGGKVARGGLRWSDRLEDFRTEVLGLVKAQMTKNSVIIPVGSKGGFVVKKAPSTGGREAFIAEGIECYKTFLRGLLDITDNMIDNKVSPPKNVIRHDGDDAYLVVAADKGTATFSDIANSISQEYNFWLGDAFASGGSAGYDHKKMGITAKGAWISVKRHFSEMNLDVDKDEFTVIGIGDMGGDVFGNGMLCSPHIKLVGAFNHLHIFFDPSPNTKDSYQERERLFELPRSSWIDYDKKLISKGGGVFERTAKSIELTPEIQRVLNISDSVLSPDELIKKMLQAPVGLLWNGGIGTYVKAKSESHDDVGDKANDSLRINGEEVKANVIGEGGNLGLTQLGRIEYAQTGGRLNTDAIDNSAGVDCSDHEVNIKITLEKAIVDNDLKRDDRNDLLESMTDEVAELCLRDNTMQTQAITVAQQQGGSIIEVLGRKVTYLEKKGLLNREIEFLPSKEEIATRHAEGKGLTRPEISVILAYSKIVLFEELVNSNLPDDEFYKEDLIRYFPVKLQDKYRKQIEQHPLRREIIATSVTNSILNRVGSALYYHIQENSGVASCDIARGYTIARELFEFRDLWDQVASTKSMQVEHQSEIFLKIQELAERTTVWFLRHYPQPLQVAKAIKDFQDGMKALSSRLVDVMPKMLLKDYEKRVKQYKSYGLNEDLADKIARFIALSSACDIIYISREKKLSEKVTGQLYFDLGSELNLGWIRDYIAKMPKGDYWETISHDSLIDETYDQQTRLTLSATNHVQDNAGDSISQWKQANAKQLGRYNQFIKDLKSSEEADISMVIIALRKLREISAI